MLEIIVGMNSGEIHWPEGSSIILEISLYCVANPPIPEPMRHAPIVAHTVKQRHIAKIFASFFIIISFCRRRFCQIYADVDTPCRLLRAKPCVVLQRHNNRKKYQTYATTCNKIVNNRVLCHIANYFCCKSAFATQKPPPRFGLKTKKQPKADDCRIGLFLKICVFFVIF